MYSIFVFNTNEITMCASMYMYIIFVYIYINIVTTCNAFIFMSEFHNGNLFGCYRVYKKNI